MKVDNRLVKHLAELARIELDENRMENVKEGLSDIIDYIGVIDRLDTRGADPMFHLFSTENILREDVEQPSFKRDELLENAPSHTDEAVIVPKPMD